ncbi:MAG: PIN domain-containing protein [Pirellulales bacterium]
MAKRLLDTSLLIPFFRGRRRQYESPTVQDAAAWARELIHIHGDGVIASPVYLEFTCGVDDDQEMSLALAFLDEFENIDGGHISDEDWKIAIQRAQRIFYPGRKRQVVDCLLFAIARRLNCDLKTKDRDLRRRR